MAQKAEKRKVARKQYVAPRLEVYGSVRVLTRALSFGVDECGNNGAKKGCRP